MRCLPEEPDIDAVRASFLPPSAHRAVLLLLELLVGFVVVALSAQLLASPAFSTVMAPASLVVMAPAFSVVMPRW